MRHRRIYRKAQCLDIWSFCSLFKHPLMLRLEGLYNKQVTVSTVEVLHWAGGRVKDL